LSSYPLYSTHAHLWPMLAPLESYEGEMAEWCGIIERELSVPEDLEILDLGTGGGHHLYHLLNQLPGKPRAVAVDLSREMLERVQSLVPRVECLQQDMTTLRLDRHFSLIVVHDSFCYLTQAAQLSALFSTIFIHLDEAGLALLKLDAVKDTFSGPYRYLTNFGQDAFDITLTHYEWDPDPSDSQLEVIYLFLERLGDRVETREERHALGLFGRDEIVRLALEQGLRGALVELEPWDEERENLLLVVKKVPTSAS
jgi:SAM-dependent methyltransferase